MYPASTPNIAISKKQQAAAIRQELHTQREKAAQQAINLKRAEQQQLSKVRELELELEAAKAARERRKAESVGRKPGLPPRVSKRLQDTGRLVLEEESSKRLSGSQDSINRPRSSESPECKAQTQHTSQPEPLLPAGALTPKQARAMVNTRIKAYAARVKQEFKPVRNERKQLQMDLLREQHTAYKPPKHPRVRLLEMM